MKKIIAVLVIIGILSFNMVALADESITLGENEQIELLELIEKYDLIILNTNDTEKMYNDSNVRMMKDSEKILYKVNNIKELEKIILLVKNEKESDIIVNEHTLVVSKLNEKALSRSEQNHERHYKSWSPFANGMNLFSWEHVYTNFNYTDEGGIPVFTKINSVDSDMTGVNIAFSYTHKSHTESFSNNNKTVEIKARGRAVFGIDFEGFTIGVPYTKYITDKFNIIY